MPTPLELNWSQETITTGGFTQDTGGINVGVSYVNDGSGTSFSNSTSPQFVGTGETFSTSSSLQLGGDGNNGTAADEQTSTTTLDFSAVDGSDFSFEVEDVSFRINDFDTSSWIDVVTVRAYDANGNLLDVTLTWNGTALPSTNTTLTSNVANGSAATETGSILVEIAGPVASIEIDYENNGTGGQALWVTDVQFNAIDLDGTVEGSSGDDVIDDTYILGPDGDKVDADDEMSAGIGTDTLYGGGGDGNDTFQFSDSDGTNTVVGGEGDDTGLGDILNTNAPSDVTITSAGDEAGTMTQGTTTVEFSEIEFIQTDSGNDTVDISNYTTGMTVLTYEGNDTVYGGSGGDNLNGLGGMIRWMATVVLTLLRVGPAMIQSSLPKATPRLVARATICSCSRTLAKPPTEPSQLMVGQATKPSAVAIRCNSATLVF